MNNQIDLESLITFLESKPNQEQIEIYYLNKISVHTKESINDILINKIYDLNCNSDYENIPRLLKLIKY